MFEKTIELVKIDDKLNLIDALKLSKIITFESFMRQCATMQLVHREHEKFFLA